jgi:hypothetical protein
MQLINGVSSFFFTVSALNSIKTKNFLWIFANFFIIYTSFMYNIHKFDLYEKFPDKIILLTDLSDKYDVYLFNDYIAISLLAFIRIDNLIIKNSIFPLFFIEYYYYKSILYSKNIVFIVGIANTLNKINKNYKIGLINYRTYFSTGFNLIFAIITLLIRLKYCYVVEKQFENVILTTLWHYYMANVLYNVSYNMFIEVKEQEKLLYKPPITISQNK